MNINEVKQILTKYDVSVKKQFGQNFLMDNNIVNKICDISNITKEVNVIEIGPGLGFLTEELKKRANKVMCYEIDSEMVKVITYGTYDLLHYGHIRLLERAKALGDYLVVAISTDDFNWKEKQKKCYFSYEQRKEMLEALRYVDLVIPEESWAQKRTDVHEYHIDTFVIGDDWKGKFDFLEEEGVEVVYLPRTPEISTTQIRIDLNK